MAVEATPIEAQPIKSELLLADPIQNLNVLEAPEPEPEEPGS